METNEITAMLIKARKHQGLTQATVARKAGYRSSQYVSNWERGITTPSLKVVKRLIKILDLNPRQVIATYLTVYKRSLKKELN